MEVIRIVRETDAAGNNTEEVIRARGTARGGMMNPREISVGKTVAWKESGGARRDHPRLQFEGGASRTLTLSLFFDTLETGEDVRDHTGKVAALARFEGELHRPPVCLVEWGPDHARGDLPFRGVVTSLTQKFTYFAADGTPVRAVVDVSFKEYEPPGRQERRSPTSSPDRRKTRVVRRGDTLWSIAAAEYDDPAQWRPIARENGIRNPRELRPGALLVIPALE